MEYKTTSIRFYLLDLGGKLMKVMLPDKDTIKKEYDIGQYQSIVIIGANGSGKSRLGAWIERNNMKNVHRIAAQRSLVVPDYVSLKSYEQAFDELFWGDTNKNPQKGQRWEWGKYTTSLLNDYDKVLSTLFAKQNKLYEQYVRECKEKEASGLTHDKAPKSEIDIIIELWKDIFPHREIILSDAKVSAKLSNSEYPGKEMSDGERVALYLMGQCLCAPMNSIIIIDEPELHLHRSIMNRLWSKLEGQRKDCLFIYITHDIQFASAHRNSKKLWVHEYLGNDNWNYEFVEGNDDIPEELLLELLGTRKKVLFVEGTRDSFDYSLYQYFYSDFYIVPCKSCLKVIESTKAMRNHRQLHHLEAYGLIDRDYRTEEEIKSLKEQNVYTLNIAEVENLFIVTEILEVVAENQALDSSKVKDAIEFIKDIFSKSLETQIRNAVVSEIKFLLSNYDINDNNIEGIQQKANNILQVIDVKQIENKYMQLFEKLNGEDKYEDILMYFNNKGIAKSIGNIFGLKNNEYIELVLRLLNTDKKEKIINGLEKYLPKIS